MGKEKIRLGRKGEELARKYLTEMKYEIVTSNFKYRNGEIDIIARQEDVLVFFEVKTRANKRFGDPEFSITKRKHTSIYRTAEYYLYKNNIEDVDCRVDLITILINHNDSFKLNHYENI